MVYADPAPPADQFGAVVLTGGTGSRLDGADKAGLVVAGRPLLATVLQAAAGAAQTVVVGPPAAAPARVRFTREDPPGGGPAAATLAGVAALTGDVPVVVVLACDLPHLTRATVRRLVAAVHAAPDVDGACLVDVGGRRQPLTAAYRPGSLVRSAPEDAHGLSMRRLVKTLDLVEVPTVAEETCDIDTWEDLRTADRPAPSRDDGR